MEWGAGGGNLIDAFTVQGGSDGLLEWLPAVNKRHGFVAQEVRVSNDGTNGEPAKIVVRGRAASVSLLDVALGGLAEPPLWDLETVFTLYPNSDFVFIETVAGNLSEESELVRLGDFVHVAPTMRALYQGQGFTERGPVTATNEETTPQAVWTKADLSYLLIGRQEETLLNTPLPIRLSCVGQEEDYFVSPGGTARFERVLFLHDGSWASAQTRLNDYRKTFSSAGTRQAAELAIAIGFQPRMETENVTLWLTQKTESDTFKIVSQSFGISGETTVIKMETTGSLSAFADHATLGIGTAAGVNVRLDRENRVTANLPIGAIVEISALDPLVQLDGSVVGMPVMANFFTLGSLVPEWVIPVPVTGAVLHLPLPENSGQREFRLVVAHGPVYIPDRQTIQLRSSLPVSMSLHMERAVSKLVTMGDHSFWAYGLDLASVGELSLTGGYSTARQRQDTLAAAGINLLVEAQNDIQPGLQPSENEPAMLAWQRRFPGTLLEAPDGRLLALSPQVVETPLYDPIGLFDTETGGRRTLTDLFPDVSRSLQAEASVLLEPRFSKDGLGWLDRIGFDAGQGLTGLAQADAAVLKGITFLELSSSRVDAIAPIYILQDFAALQNERSPLYLISNSGMDAKAREAGNPGSMAWLRVASLPEESISHILLADLLAGHVQAGTEALLLYGMDAGMMGDVVVTDDEDISLMLSIQIPQASPIDTLLFCQNGDVLNELYLPDHPDAVETETALSLEETRPFPSPGLDSWLMVLAYASNGQNTDGLTTRKPAFVVGQPLFLDMRSDGAWIPPALNGFSTEQRCLTAGLCRAFAGGVNPLENRVLPQACCDLDPTLQGCSQEK